MLKLKLKLKLKFRFYDYLIYIAFLILLITKVPEWISNYKIEGSTLDDINLVNIKTSNVVRLGSLRRPKVIILWASWCIPCKLELSRFNNAIQNGDILKKDFYAVNFNESQSVIRRTIAKRGHIFNVFTDLGNNIAKKIGIKSVPTLIFLNKNNEIYHYSTGISPLGIIKAKQFLDSSPI